MNYCLINGHKAYPAFGSNIKVTRENPLIKDRDAQTMEIEFPLAIAQNRAVFGSVDRIDVSKHTAGFESCALYSGNVLVIQGKGTVTTFSDTSVKMQIVSGMRTTEYSEDWEKVYIDRIDAYDTVNMDLSGRIYDGYVGWVYELPPVYDESNDRVLNCKNYTYEAATDSYVVDSVSSVPYMQPYLRYVVKKVLAYVGYTLGTCFLDEEPWNRVLIYNSRFSLGVRGALPHWSVKTFLSEFKKLFNCSFVFNDTDKTVTIQRLTDTLETACYECSDEFSSDYDEDGLEYIGSSNIAYSLSDSEENTYADMTEENLTKYAIEEFSSLKEATAAADSMSLKEKRTTVFRVTDDTESDRWYYCKTFTGSDGTTSYSLAPFGWYMHLRREEGSDNTVELLMVPCADHYTEFEFKFVCRLGGTVREKIGFSMPSSTDSSSSDIMEDDYVSVEDCLEQGEDPASDEEDARMELYFRTGNEHSFDFGGKSNTMGDDIKGTTKYMAARSWYGKGSFRFEGGLGEHNIGEFHSGSKMIENREQIVIKFLADSLPDPKKIFIFRNKRFLCDKVEMSITDSGVEKLMTGYFYELF